MGGFFIELFVAGIVLVWASALVYYDLYFHRLPDYLTLPAAAICVGWTIAQPDTRGILVAASVWPGLYLLQLWLPHLSNSASNHQPGLGGGDIKLAVSLGIVAAVAGGILAVLAAAGLAALVSLLAAVIVRRGFVAHGRAMILATVIVSISCVE